MTKELQNRSGGKCELCSVSETLFSYSVIRIKQESNSQKIAICQNCIDQISEKKELNPNHWRCLNESIWSEIDAVKVVAFRVLSSIHSESWTNDLLEMMYLDDDLLSWAKEGLADNEIQKHRDCNGIELLSGDSIVITKDLKVKGGGFTAKRGTSVRNIKLVHNNPDQIEGKVDGQTIIILTEYTKK